GDEASPERFQRMPDLDFDRLDRDAEEPGDVGVRESLLALHPKDLSAAGRKAAHDLLDGALELGEFQRRRWTLVPIRIQLLVIRRPPPPRLGFVSNRAVQVGHRVAEVEMSATAPDSEQDLVDHVFPGAARSDQSEGERAE